MPLHLLGVDFTSVPSRRKPITVARGQCSGGVLRVSGVEALTAMPAFEALLAEAGPWLGAFDFPFGLPRAFTEALALGADVAQVSAAVHARCADRMAFRALVDGWGQGLPHRATDLALGVGLRSTSPLQTRYVPVGFMWFEGLSRLLAAGVSLPGLTADARPGQGAGAPLRQALEGYPGAVAHAVLGRRSYKNSDEPDRLIARIDLVDALEQGRLGGCRTWGAQSENRPQRADFLPGSPPHSRAMGQEDGEKAAAAADLQPATPKADSLQGGPYAGAPRLKLSHPLRESLVADASGDRLDAVLCLLQAAWAAERPGFGLPDRVDPVEGWILGAGLG